MASVIRTPFIEQVTSLLNGLEKQRIDNPRLVPAAVLLLLFEKDEQYHLIFNRRTHEVEHHKGEISFPGGAFDEGDGDLETTALRETWEEMGIRREHVLVLGELDDFETRSNFKIAPYVGVIPYPYPYKYSPIEVAEVLEVPINHLLDPANQSHTIEDRIGHPGTEHTYRYGETVIWGATARILHQFLTLIG